MSKTRSAEPIRLTIAESNGIKYEKMNEFCNSLCRDVYYDAFVKTKQLIKNNEAYKTENHWHHERTYNIISFCGRRGMGKTSAMKSFLSALDEFDEEGYKDFSNQFIEQEKILLTKENELENCEFICLECIDASLLEKNEDIFEVVLAKMLSEIIKEVRSCSNNTEWEIKSESRYVRYRKEDIFSKMENIYEGLCNIRNAKKREKSGTGAMGILQTLSGSLELREKFEELVSLYLRVVSKKSSNRTDGKRFLVISIDDLDMNESGYEMLEQIHRYFMVPDVLIYITVSEEELLRSCVEHFGDERISRNYIDKVLPSSKRIYMPDISLENIEILPRKFDIKKTFLWKIAERTNIYFDGCGKKAHFYEPRDIRSLVNMNLKMNEMEEVNSTGKDAYRANVTLLLQDALYRLTYEKLSKEYRERFWDVFGMETERQGRAITERIIQLIGKGKCVEAYNRYGYSYGELLRSIYTMGRVNSAYKGIGQCVLAVHTIQLCQIQEQIMKEMGEKKEKPKRIYQRLFECMNGSVTGSWGDKLIPKIQSEEQLVSWGYMRGTISGKSGIYKPIYNSELTEDSLIAEIKDFFENDDIGIVKSLVLFTMFLAMHEKSTIGKYKIRFDNKKDAGSTDDDKLEGLTLIGKLWGGSGNPPILRNVLESGKEHQENGEENGAESKKMVLQLNEGKIIFDITGFVINCMKYSQVFQDVKEELIEAYRKMCNSLPNYLKEIESDIDFKKPSDMDRKIEAIITEKLQTLESEVETWYKGTKGFSLPICSTDIFYNVIKRAKTKNSEANVYSIDESGIVESMETAFRNISEELEKEDKYYENKLNLKNNFEECPIVKMILEHRYPKGFEELLKVYVPELASVQATADSEKILDEV